jgi:hypothetical protein
MLPQLASQHAEVFEKLLDAYRRIFEMLPSVRRLTAVFGHDKTFQDVLGLVYCDIAEFHQGAYKVVQRRGT